MVKEIGVVLAFFGLLMNVASQECYICPGGSLRDYWILQMEVSQLLGGSHL